MKKILFLINGYGLGNSTRCHAIISRLKNSEIDVASSQNGFAYFSRVKKIKTLIRLEPLSYGLRGGRISLLETFRQVPKVLQAYLANVKIIERQLARKNYDLLVTDSDYSTLLLKNKIACPVTSINNADSVLLQAITGKKIPLSILPQLFVEILDFAYHAAVSDSVISPTLRPQKDFLHFTHIPPIIRSGISSTKKPRKKKTRKTKNVMVMTSGSALGTDLSKKLPCLANVTYQLIGLKGSNSKFIKYVEKNRNNIPFLNQADLLVINGGFSSVSEAYSLNKPTLVIPLPNHAEQFYNAKQIQELGLGLVCQESNFGRQIVRALKYAPKQNKVAERGDGAKSAASLIAGFSR